MGDSVIPDGDLRFSEAVNRLANGMWGGLARPDQVRSARQIFGDRRAIEYGPWCQAAGERLTGAACQGKLAVYISCRPELVPPRILQSLVKTRGCLPDHPLRPPRRFAEENEQLFSLDR